MNADALSSFERDIVDTLSAIQQCVADRRHMATKMLIYSLIDSLAWAASDKKPKSTRRNFEEWVAKWMIPNLAVTGVPIEPLDLYAARCAVLHTMTPDSDLSQAGAARTIAYAWGTGKTEFLDFAFSSQSIPNVLAVHYDALVSALRNGIADCLAAADSDEVLRENLDYAAKKHYAYIPVRSGGRNDG